MHGVEIWRSEMQRIYIFLGLVILTLGAVACAKPVNAKIKDRSSEPHGITVSGEGTLNVVPDVAIVHMGVEVLAPSVDAAYQSAARVLDSLKVALRTAGVADNDVRTVQSNIYPQRRMTKEGDDSITGYQAANNIVIKVRPVTDAGAILSHMTEAAGNAVRVHSVQFAVDRPETLKPQLEELAMQDAKAQAQRIAQLAGMSLGDPVSVTVGIEPPFPPVVKGGRGGFDVPFNAGEMELKLSVQMVYDFQSR